VTHPQLPHGGVATMGSHTHNGGGGATPTVWVGFSHPQWGWGCNVGGVHGISVGPHPLCGGVKKGEVFEATPTPLLQ
jgi:hypothetical protein